MRHWVTTWVVLLLIGGAASSATALDPETLEYNVQPIPLADRTDIQITVSISGLTGPLEIGLPADCYGYPDLHEFVTSITGTDGTTVGEGSAPDHRRIEAAADGVARLSYRMSFDPVALQDYAFAPNTGPGHFHVGGCQWMLRMPGDDAPRPYRISLGAPPEGWTLYSSLAPDARPASLTTTWEQLNQSALGGGSGPHRRFEINGRPVSVFLANGLNLPSRQVLDSVEAIVTAQRTRFRENPPPFYVVSVNPRDGVVAGAAIPNLFVCFIDPDAPATQLVPLLAHEMFHNEIPGALSLKTPSGESGTRLEWFHEGVADFGSRLLMLQSGAIDHASYAALFNLDLERLRASPARAATLADLYQAARENRFSSMYKKLSYYRGSLIALSWNAQIRRNHPTKDIFDLFAALKARAPGGVASEEDLYAVGLEFGLDTRTDFERHVLRGEPISPLADTIEGYRLVSTSGPGHQTGFDVPATFRQRVMTDVAVDGPAYAAGLRDGMPFVRMSNVNTDSNSWRADLPASVRVMIDGAERQYDFLPYGPIEPQLRFEPAPH